MTAEGMGITIGVLATLYGPYSVMGQDGLRGAQLAVDRFGSRVAGKFVRVITEGSNAIPDDAVSAVQSLLDDHHVDFVIGPLSGNEGLAVRDYARLRPERAFINGVAGTQDITLRDPAPNFYSFSTHGVQWMAGLGSYVYKELGYRRMVTLAEDYSYPYTQVGGFMLEFCREGGKITRKFWVSLNSSNFSSVIAEMPKDIDAIFVALAGADAIYFLEQYIKAGGSAPLVAGTSTVDQTVLGQRGALSDRLVGTVSSGPCVDDNPLPEWQQFVNAYRRRYPDGLPSPSLVAYGYYVNMLGALLALDAVGGDLSNKQAAFQKALRTLEFDSPTGKVRLDHNRQAVATIFISEVDRKADGGLYTRLVRTLPNIDSTLGIPETEFLALGPFTTDNPRCP